jgi:hypothetical protein
LSKRAGCLARLNATLRNCGRSIIVAKLQDLADRFGITVTEVNPAYTSQTCSACGHVDKRNRHSQQVCHCLWCGQPRRWRQSCTNNQHGSLGGGRLRRALDCFQQRPIPAVSLINDLVDHGVLLKVTDQRRKLLFLLHNYLELFRK